MAGTKPMHGSHGEAPYVGPLGQLLRLLRPDLTDIVVVGIFSLVVGLLSLATPITVEALVNTVTFGRYLQPLVVLAIMLFAFLGFAALLKGLQTYIAEIMQRRVFVRVVMQLAEKLPRVKRDAFAEQHGPEMINRFFEVITVQKSAALLVLDGIAIVITAIIGMIVLAFYHPYLLGFDLLLMGSVAFAVFALGRGAVDTAINESYKKYAVASWLEQLAMFPTTFKLDGGRQRARERADELTVDYLKARQNHFAILIRQIIFSLALQAVAGASLLGIGGFLVINGQLTLGQLVAAELIVAVIVGSFAKLGKHMESYYDLLAACDKLGHLFDLPTERDEGVNPQRLSLGARVALHRVTLQGGHHGATAPHASNPLSLVIEPGERVAISGPPGSGKSHLLEMLYALDDPAHGYIEFDALDLRSVSPAALREQVALVQSIEVFEGTVAENIDLGRAGINYEDVRQVLEDLDLWNEVMHLPEGLQTKLSPTGNPLSGSQLIRLALARALVSKPRLMMVDTILDQLADHQLRRVLDALTSADRSRTLIIVSGRDGLLSSCDRAIHLGPDFHSDGTSPEEDPTSSGTKNRLGLVSVR